MQGHPVIIYGGEVEVYFIMPFSVLAFQYTVITARDEAHTSAMLGLTL